MLLASWVSVHSRHNVLNQCCPITTWWNKVFPVCGRNGPMLLFVSKPQSSWHLPTSCCKRQPSPDLSDTFTLQPNWKCHPKGIRWLFFYVHDKKQENEKLREAGKIAETWQGMTFTWAICQFQRDIWSKFKEQAASGSHSNWFACGITSLALQCTCVGSINTTCSISWCWWWKSGHYLLQNLLFLTVDALYFSISNLSKYTSYFSHLTETGGVMPTMPTSQLQKNSEKKTLNSDFILV